MGASFSPFNLNWAMHKLSASPMQEVFTKQNSIGSSSTYFDNAFTLQLIQRNVYGQNGLTMILHATVMVTQKYILSITRD